jgi:N6-adenosine-specific RNA methylase IME4
VPNYPADIVAAYRIIEGLGLTARTMLTWGKDRIGRGRYLRDQTEHCIFATRGRPVFQLAAESTLMLAPRGAHSEKPAAFYDLVERVCPAPRYACLFSHLQAPRPAWDQHSTEAREAVPGSQDNPPAKGGRSGAAGRSGSPRAAAEVAP